MITLITGTPGSGKTLYAVTKILEYVEQNKKLLEQGKEPRLIYSNIDGLNIDGVEPAPKDWRDTPDGSVIFYDEIQQLDEYKKSRYDNEICDSLQVHRHTGHDIYGITQFPVLLHPNFRAVVGMHQHLHRGWGLSSATVFNWAYCVDAPNAPSNKKLCEHTFRFAYPKDVYKYYKSATVHTHKARIPKKIFLGLLALLLVGWFAFDLLFNKDNFFKNIYGGNSSKEPKTVKSETAPSTFGLSVEQDKTIDSQDLPQPTEPPLPTQEQLEQQKQSRRVYLLNTILPQDYEIMRTDPMLQVRGVMMMGNTCKAYNAYNDVMTLSQADCKDFLTAGRVFKPDPATQQQIAPPPQPAQPSPAEQPPQPQAYAINQGDKEPLFDMGS